MNVFAGRYNQQKVTIAEGDSKSGWLDILGYRVAGILVPANTVGEALRLWADVVGNDDTGAIIIAPNDDEIRMIWGSGTLPLYIAAPQQEGTNLAKIPQSARLAVQTLDADDSYNPVVQTQDIELTVVLEPLGY